MIQKTSLTQPATLAACGRLVTAYWRLACIVRPRSPLAAPGHPETMDRLAMMSLQAGAQPNTQVLDLAHLSAQTLGDEGLKREVLGLFVRQARMLMERLSQSSTDQEARFTLAHTLKGSALAIGAFAVAEAAEALEAVPNGADATAMTSLAVRVEEALAAIVQLDSSR